MATLNGKFMEEKLKIGWTVEDFAGHFCVSSEEFYSLLRKNFSRNAYRSMTSRLEKNAKRKKRYSQPRAKKIPTTILEESKTLEMLDTEDLKTPDVSEEISEPVTEEISEKSTEFRLEVLRKEETRIRKEICEKEVSKKRLFEKRRTLQNSLKKKKEELLRLDELIAFHKTEIDNIITQLSSLKEQASSLTADIKFQQNELSAIQSDIKTLQKVVIYVYDAGEIESENFEVQISDSWSEIYSKIVNLDEVDVLTVKQTKQLAKVLSFIHFLQQQNLEFEITFDNATVEALFNKLHQSQGDF